MISCTEFIPAYNELFKFLHKEKDIQAVEMFWRKLSDSFLENLRDLAQKKGLNGCFEYWKHTLGEEAADCRLTLDNENKVFKLEMFRCPSMTRLMQDKNIRPYKNYCKHCDTLYRNILEPLGFEYTIDLSRCSEAKCQITVRKN